MGDVMTDVKRLLDEATPLPWSTTMVGVSTKGVGADYQAPTSADDDLIVYAVNHLADYEAVVDALASCTSRRDCGHGHIDVIHVAPAHFDGPACPNCSLAEYADAVQRREPCSLCAALRRLRGASDV